MFTVHHLGVSQSERIVWLCEELEIPYDLKVYRRDPVSRLAPPEYRALHPMGAAPVMTDDNVVLAESGAIVDYILAKYGEGRLAIRADDDAFADYLYWLHFSNGTLQPAIGRLMTSSRSGVPEDHQMMKWLKERQHRMFDMLEARLGNSEFLAGDQFTAADIMIVFSLTTMRNFQPIDLSPYPNIRAYLKRMSERPGYQRALAKGDPGMTPLIS